MLLARMDQFGRTAWLALTLLAFWLAWPVGLAVVAFLAGSGRLKAWRQAASTCAPGVWHNLRSDAEKAAQRFRSAGTTSSSGNEAFDDYRAGELKRLEEEEREFKAFLEQLRRSRDRAEFDGFMAEQRRRKAAASGAGSTSP